MALQLRIAYELRDPVHVPPDLLLLSLQLAARLSAGAAPVPTSAQLINSLKQKRLAEGGKALAIHRGHPWKTCSFGINHGGVTRHAR